MIATIKGRPSARCASKRLWSPAAAQPYWQRILHRSRVNALACQSRPIFAGPVYVFVLTNPQQQIELLSKKRVIVLEFQAEQWKRLDERTATYNHFRPALRKKIESSEVLKHPYRVG